jgi:hypothetical protein
MLLRLRHPRIIRELFDPHKPSCGIVTSDAEIYGASIVDDDPFIVMPLFTNGNARSYVEKNPQCNRLNFVSDPYFPNGRSISNELFRSETLSKD